MICKECGNEILPGTLFCTNCGAKAEAPEQEADSDKTVVLWDEEPKQPKQDDDRTVVLWDEEPKSQSQGSTAPRKCPNCGFENMGDALFCVECGALMSEPKPQPVTPPPAAQPSMTTPPPAGQPFMTPPPPSMGQQAKPKKEKAPKPPKAPKQQGEAAKNGKLPIIIGAVAAVVVVIIGAVLVMSGLSSKSAGDARLVYLKDDEFYMAKRSSFQPELITDSFFEDEDDADSVHGMWSDDEELFQYTEDGKYLFYPQDYGDYGVFDLYYKKAGSKEEGTKLESGVSSYHVSSADKILYVKSDKLYLASLKGEKEKIASDVDDDYSYDYGISENGQYIFWYDDGNYYVQDMNLKKEKVKIKDVYRIVYRSKDMKEIYYTSDDTLYVMKNLKDKVKIASDIKNAFMLGEGDNKKLYYITQEDDAPYTYADLVKNDVKKDSEYYEYADEILEELKYSTLNVSEYKAYTYSAATGKSEEVAGFYGNSDTIWGNDGSRMAYYFDIDIDTCDKLKLSDVIDDFYFGNSDVNMYAAFDYYWKEQADFYLLTADKLIPVAGMQEFYEKPGKIEVRDFALNSVTKELYMPVWYYDEDGSTYDLYVIPYTDKEVECRLITNDLYSGSLWQSEQGIAYLCDVDKDGEEGTLFLNGIELAKDVYPGYIKASEDALYYIKDISSDHNEGTLYMNKNGKETEIAEDVANTYYGVLSDGSVAYLADYSYKKRKGDLFVFTGKKSIAVDEDVAAVILY